MLAKRFFYVSAALFLLALTYHLGARQADAQAPGNPVVGVAIAAYGGTIHNTAITANGDFYYSYGPNAVPLYSGNIFGVPTSTTGTSWGKVKADYRK